MSELNESQSKDVENNEKPIKKAFKGIYVAAGVLATLLSIVTFFVTQYSSYSIYDLTSTSLNPTRPNPMFVARASAKCKQGIMMAKLMARGMGSSEAAAVKRAEKKCRTFRKEDPKAWELAIAFTHKGKSSMNNLSVSYLASNEKGEEVGSGELDRKVLSGDERFFEKKLKVNALVKRLLICISYDSGPYRRSWKLFDGRPGNAHMPLGGFGSFKTYDEGYEWFAESACQLEIERIRA